MCTRSWISLGLGPLPTFVEKEVWIFTPPLGASLSIFSDDDSEPHTSSGIAVLARLSQLNHLGAEIIATDGRSTARRRGRLGFDFNFRTWADFDPAWT